MRIDPLKVIARDICVFLVLFAGFYWLANGPVGAWVVGKIKGWGEGE